MMSTQKGRIALGTLIAAIALALGAASAQGESACKGLEKAACEKNSSCTWVDGYKRKDGVEVDAHCKGKPTPSGEKESSSKKEKK